MFSPVWRLVRSGVMLTTSDRPLELLSGFSDLVADPRFAFLHVPFCLIATLFTFALLPLAHALSRRACLFLALAVLPPLPSLCPFAPTLPRTAFRYYLEWPKLCQ